MKTSIIILTYNKLNYTKLCIESIRKYTDNGTYEVIVVDNNSSDGTVEWLKKQRDIVTIFNNENFGFPKGCNQGIEVAEGENILLLNNDTIMTKNWLINMTKCLYSNINIGAVGCVTNYCSNCQVIQAEYQTIDELFDFCEKYNVSNEELWEERLRLIGFCVLIKKEVVNKVGLLDEIFTPGNFEDDDYSFRAVKAGYKLMLCKDTFIHHFGSTSFKENYETFNENLVINEEKFKQKWGFYLNEDFDTHPNLSNILPQNYNDKFKLLEIGCGVGANLRYIKNMYKNAELYGIDKNINALSIASTFVNTQSSDMENMNLEYEKGFFDFIIVGNILQQLKNPKDVIKYLEPFLNNKGKLLVCVPDSGNASLLNNNIYINDSLSYYIKENKVKLFNYSLIHCDNGRDIEGLDIEGLDIAQ